MVRFLCIVFACIALFPSCKSPAGSDDPLSTPIDQEKARKDFSVFSNILEEAHPALTQYLDEKRKNFLFDSVSRTIDNNQTVRSFYNKLSFLINEVSCSHTYTALPQDVIDSFYNKKLFFPYPLIYIQGALYANSDAVIGRGTKLVSINGIPVAKLLDSLSIYNPVEGAHRETQRYLTATDFSYDFFVKYGGFSEFELLVKDSAGRIKTIKEEAISLADLAKQSRYYYDATDVPYYLSFNDNYNYAYIRLATFEFPSVNQQNAFENFLKNSFDLIRRRNDVDALVIDVRENRGGDLYNCFLLNSYLCRKPFSEYKSVSTRVKKIPFAEFLSDDFEADDRKSIMDKLKDEFTVKTAGGYQMADSLIEKWSPAKNNFSKKIFIITNSEVVSSGSYFTLLAKNTAGAKVVGTETCGGDFSGNGFGTLYYVLPNSRIRLQFDFAHISYSNGGSKPAGGVVPDYIIPDSYESFIGNDDRQLIYIADSLISKKK
jgi:hypothetical protein